jgi:hypothetical protein
MKGKVHKKKKIEVGLKPPLGREELQKKFAMMDAFMAEVKAALVKKEEKLKKNNSDTEKELTSSSPSQSQSQSPSPSSSPKLIGEQSPPRPCTPPPFDGIEHSLRSPGRGFNGRN